MTKSSTAPTHSEPVAICQWFTVWFWADSWVSKAVIFSLYSGMGSGVIENQLACAAGEDSSRMRMRCFMCWVGLGG